MSNQLTKKDVDRAMLRSLCYQQQCFNFETMQSLGFTQIVAPVIEKVYEGDDDLIEQKIDSYLSTFYNTENTVGQIIHGAVVGMEASGVPEVTDTAVAMRTSLMGPFAGLGDSIFKVGAKVIFGSLAGYMALENSIIGVLLCIAFFCICNGPIRCYFFKQGYKQGVEFITTKHRHGPCGSGMYDPLHRQGDYPPHLHLWRSHQDYPIHLRRHLPLHAALPCDLRGL